MLRTTTKILRGFSQKPSFNKIISRPYYRRAMESLLQPKPKTLTPEISNKPRASFSVASAIGTAFAGSMFAGTGWLLYHYGFREREIPITGCYVDLTKNDHNGLILSNKKFKKVGEKVKGELSGAVLQNIDSNKNFLEKGAMNHASLIVEVVIADFLNMVRPGEQPASLIMEEMQDSGIARFFTLSEIYPDSMDLEDFVLNKNCRACR